uniref:YtxH domain-containing protein n=1 Tax=Gracilibacillus sp. JCM 18860 TaxID=1306159 RepID=UPI000AE123B3
MINTKSLMLGIVVGGVVSATATLLSTPKSGKDLRNNMKHYSNEAIDSFNRFREDGMDIKEQITKTSKEGGVSLIKDLSLDVKESIESWKKTVEPPSEKYPEVFKSNRKKLKRTRGQNQKSYGKLLIIKNGSCQ